MKKIASLILIVFSFTLNTQAQKKDAKVKAEKLLKKMTSNLNLTENQQLKIKPLLISQIEDKKSMKEKKKELKKAKKKVKGAKKELKKEKLANKNAMNAQLKSILNKQQFEKYNRLLEEDKIKKKEKSKKKKEKQ